jgi:tetratricopeptide (TPR) repeat protein
MAKLISYNPDRERKLGFRKVIKEEQAEEDGSQLNLFQEHRDVQILRHLNPFEKGLQLDEKNEELAEKLYQESIRTGVAVADAYCNLGILYAGKGQTAKAIDSFTHALIKDPRHTEAHYNLANMYYDAGNYQLALTHYEVASHMEDAFPEIIYNLALTQLCLDNRTEALTYLQKYIKMSDVSDTDKANRLVVLLKQ